MSQWLKNEQLQWEGPIPSPKDVVGSLTFEAYLDQLNIGWDQAFCGRVSKKWNSATITAYATEKHIGDLVMAEQWTAKVI